MKMNNTLRSKTILASVFLALLMFIVIPNVSAADLNPFADTKNHYTAPTLDMSDFVKTDFNSKYGVIELRSNFMWVDTGKVAEYSLIQNTEKCVDCEQVIKVTLYEDSRLMDNINQEILTGDKTPIANLDILLLTTEEYIVETIDLLIEPKEVCYTDEKNATKVCTLVWTYKNETKTRDVWVSYKGEILKAGNYQYKIIGTIGTGQKIDIIQNTRGQLFEEWAPWTSADCKGIGGAITIDGDYCVHTFTTNSSFNNTKVITNASILIVAGGGAASQGGGGAGGLIYNNSYDIAASSYLVKVGAGGLSGGYSASGSKGANSSWGGTIFNAEGGGPGIISEHGLRGGSGAGGGSNGGGVKLGGAGFPGQGNYGGNSTSTTGYGTGGGGGASAGGKNGNTTTSGNGGDGLAYTINGSSVYYAGGGGGGCYYNTMTWGTGGLGGGGNGSATSASAGDGINGLGGGGGGEGNYGGSIPGDGGSGVIIVRYLAGLDISLNINNSIPAANISTSSVTFGCNATSDGQNISSIVLNVTGTATWTQTQSGLAATSVNQTFVNNTLADGTYTWNCIGYGSAGVNASSAMTMFSKDATKPSVTIIYPTAVNYTTNVSELNYTYADANPGSCWYSLDNGDTNTSVACGTNLTGLTSVEGSNTWRVYGNDTFGNTNTTTSVTFFKDTIFPQIDYNAGTQASGVTDHFNNIYVNTTWTEVNFKNITFRRTGTAEVTYATPEKSINWTGLADGFYVYNVTLCDQFNQCNTTANRNKTIDTVHPIMIMTYPVDGTDYAINVSDLNYTITHPTGTMDSCWYSLNNGGTNVSVACGTNLTGLTSTEGSNTWCIYGNDTAGGDNVGSHCHTFTKDTINPTINFTSPTTPNGTKLTTRHVIMNVTSTDTNIKNISIRTYDSTNVLIETNTWTLSAANSYYWDWTAPTDGTFFFNASVVDNPYGNYNNTETRTVYIDTAIPVTSIVYPTATQYTTNISTLNYTFVETNPDSCWYSTNNGVANSTTVAAGTNFTSITSVEGSNTWKLYCNDTFGNQNVPSSVTFTKDTINPLISITYPTTNTNYSNYVTMINYTVSDTNLDTCKWTRDGGATNSTIACGTNLTGLGAVEGSFTYTFYVNDTFGNVNSSSVSFLVNLTKITSSPADGSTFYYNPAPLNCTVTVNSPALITNMSVWTNASGTWVQNQTITTFNPLVNTLTADSGWSTATQSQQFGFRFVALDNTLLATALKSATSTTTKAYLKSDAGAVLQTVSFVGNTATFNYALVAGTYYRLEADNNGAAYTSAYKAYAYPLVGGGGINFTQGSENGANNPDWTREWVSVTTQKTYAGTANEIFYEYLYAPTLWACSVVDSNNNTFFSENYTINPDTTKPYFSLNSLGNVTTLTLPVNATLNVTIADAGNNLLTCGYHTSDDATNYTYTCNTSVGVTFATEGAKTVTAYAIDGIGNINQTTYPVNVFYVQQQSNATSPVTEGTLSYHNLQLNMTGISSWNVTAYLVWNGTNMGYGTVTFPTANIALVNETIVVPNVPGTALNPTVSSTWFYSIGGSPNFTGNVTGTQSVFPFYLAPCDASITWKVLNISFVDETTLLPINATLDASSFVYGAGGATGKTFTYANATVHNKEYDFCITPSSVATLTAAYQLQYSHSETATYPQRRINFNETLLNSSITNHTLYLLNYNNGITSNYQVITVGNQVIAGAHIVVTRVINGNTVLITDGYTDASGQISFFLNPNFDHTFTVSATGFATQVITIRPSQAQYTITMGTQSNPFLYTNTIEGLSYQIWPPSGIILDGVYNFTFKVSNSLSQAIYNCTMNIKVPNGTFIGSAFGCNSPSPGYGGTIGVSINTTLYPMLYGEYYITLANNSVYYIERDAKWRNIHIVNSGGTNWADAVRDLIDLPEWGDCPGGYSLNSTDNNCYDQFGNQAVRGQTADFNRIVFFFLFFAIILAIVNFFTGYDTAYPGAFIYLTAVIVIGLSAVNGIAGPGYFYLADALKTDNMFGYFSSLINNWIVAINFTMLAVIYFFTTNKRYQAG